MIKNMIMICLVLVSGFAWSAGNIEDEIQEVVLDNLKYTQQENLDKVMQTVHPDSAAYAPTKNLLLQLFGNYKLKYELLKYKFVSRDEDLIIVRIKQRTTKLSGPAFNNNEIDAYQVFRQHNEKWKLWTQANISVSLIN